MDCLIAQLLRSLDGREVITIPYLLTKTAKYGYHRAMEVVLDMREYHITCIDIESSAHTSGWEKGNPCLALLLTHQMSRACITQDVLDSLLYVASRTSNIGHVRTLIDRGAHVAPSGNRGVTPLHCCMFSPEILHMLLSVPGRKEHTVTADVFGKNPLHMAAAANDYECASLLLENCPDVRGMLHQRTFDGNIPLDSVFFRQMSRLTSAAPVECARRFDRTLAVFIEAYLRFPGGALFTWSVLSRKPWATDFDQHMQQ